jgi:hypothetical protein
VCIRLHQCLVISPALPLAWGDMRDVPREALRPALEVVAIDEWRVLTRSVHYDEAPEQLHRWPHPHKHLAEVDEDCYQHDGVG